MIDAAELARWTREPLSDGSVVLTAPGGPPATSLRVRPGVRPVRPLRRIVQGLAASFGPALQDLRSITPIRRLTTDDGEHGAIVELRVRLGGRTLDWVIAAVVSDDELVVVEGTGHGEIVAFAVLGMVNAVALGTDANRIRMFVYRPPRGWFGVRRRLATCWLAPGFPRDPGHIVVCDAAPIHSSSLVALLWPSPVSDPPTPVERAKLPGHLAVARKDACTAAAIELHDATFRYRVLLYDGSDDHLAAVDSLVSTIEPCPARRLRAEGAFEAFEWLT